MVVHLHTGQDTHLFPSHNKTNHRGSALTPPLDSSSAHEAPGKNNDNDDDDFLAELTHHITQFMFQDNHHHTSHFSPGDSKQGSSECSSSHEPSPPASPGNGGDVIEKFEKMKVNERVDPKRNRGYEIRSSNNELCSSYQSLIQEQIRSIEVSRVMQEKQSEVINKSQKQKQKQKQKQRGQGYRKSEGQQFQRRGGNGGWRSRAGPQQGGGEVMRAVFLDGSGFRGGTGVFLPPAASTTAGNSSSSSSSSKSKKKQGKGCSTVLIPARVVQALQLHFDQMAATSPPTFFPPLLHDVMMSSKDGMCRSVEKLYSQEQGEAESNHLQNDMILPLPPEWTY